MCVKAKKKSKIQKICDDENFHIYSASLLHFLHKNYKYPVQLHRARKFHCFRKISSNVTNYTKLRVVSMKYSPTAEYDFLTFFFSF